MERASSSSDSFFDQSILRRTSKFSSKMNLLPGRSNISLRDAIVKGDLEKARKALNAKYNKPDVNATTEAGGFSMLHCAAVTGNSQMVSLLFRAGANLHALTDDGYSALDLALWRSHGEVIELLRHHNCIAPVKEPTSLNGKSICFLGELGTIRSYDSTTGERTIRYHRSRTEDKTFITSGRDYEIVDLKPSDISTSTSTYEKAQPYSENPHQSTEDLPESPSSQVVVELSVPPGPLGLLLNSSSSSVIVQGFQKLADGSPGMIEASNEVYPGMIITSIDDTNVSQMTLPQVAAFLKERSTATKRIKFSSKEALILDNNHEEQELINLMHKECIHCGVPTSNHESEDCPYR